MKMKKVYLNYLVRLNLVLNQLLFGIVVQKMIGKQHLNICIRYGIKNLVKKWLMNSKNVQCYSIILVNLNIKYLKLSRI